MVGFEETLDVARRHPHWSAPLGPNQGRGVASGYWFNVGGETSCGVSLLEDGIVKAAAGRTTVQEIIRMLPRLDKPRLLPVLRRMVGE